jgi:OCT family organic cation transporter-like MFS transporter 4/5
MIGKFGITTCFGAVFLYGGEIYPTNVRNVGIGMASVAARIGGMLAPFSSYLVRGMWPSAFNISFSPFVIMYLGGIYLKLLDVKY